MDIKIQIPKLNSIPLEINTSIAQTLASSTILH